MTTSPTLNAVHGKQRYCGPAAISAITGMDTDDAARLARQITGLTMIKGMSTSALRACLAECGVKSAEIVAYRAQAASKRPTFKQITRQLEWSSTYLIIAGNHFQLVSRGTFVDSITRDVVDLADPLVGQRRRVASVYRLTAPGDINSSPALLEQAKDAQRAKQRASRAFSRAKKLAKANDIRIEYDYGHGDWASYWVNPQFEIEEHADYPFEGEHLLARDEIPERIEALIKFQASIK